MRYVLRLLIQHPLLTIIALLVMALGGIYAALHMPVDLFPRLDVPVVNIITHYPGAAPEDMELLMTRPIENEMRGIPGVKRVASTSLQGISQVTVELGWGTGLQDARQLVQARLARLRSRLPAGVEPRLENIGTTLQEVVGYVVYGGGDPITLHTTVQHDIANRLMGIAGVSSVEVLGGDQRAFVARLTPAALRQANLTISDVVAALQQHHRITVAGYLERGAREYVIRGDALLHNLDDLRAVPVGSDADPPIGLSAIAQVRASRAPRHYVVTGDGRPAVAFIVRKQPGTSTLQVTRRVDATVRALLNHLPPGSRVQKYYDQSEIIAEVRDTVAHDLLIGALLAVLVLYAFMGAWRPTLVVAATIPITFMATLAMMQVVGLGLNVITMSALTLAVGMIVDDAIVVAENIFRHAQMGKVLSEASLDGAVEIATADAAGTLTTVAAFLPLLLITGLAALFLRPFGLTISSALMVSLVLSLTFVPLLFSRQSGSVRRHEGLGNRLLGWGDTTLQAVLRFCFRHRVLVLFLATLSLSGGVLSAFLGRISVLPPIDEGAILVEYVMPPGTSLTESNRLGAHLERLVLAMPDVATVYRRTGSPESGQQIEGVNSGEMLIKLQPKTVRSHSATSMMDVLKQAFTPLPGVVFLYHQPTQEKIDESFSGLPALFGATIYGPDLDTLVALAQKVERLLSKEPAVVNVINNTKIRAPQIRVQPRVAALAQYGGTVAELLATLQAAYRGIEVFRIVRQKEEIGVRVQLELDGDDPLGRLKNLPVRVGHHTAVPLARLADISVVHAPAAVTRLNGQRQITLLAEVEGNIPAVAARLQARLVSLDLPAGYSVEITGRYKTLKQTAIEMLLTLLFAVVLIFGIMAVEFGSLRQPCIIITTLPLALIGALIALFITGQGLDVSVGMGVITLVGIAVNNAIVLLDYTSQRVHDGTPLQEALLNAASTRFRPILMTALTTIFALLPTAIGSAAGSKLFQPFAITVMGGLLSATVATLIVIPTLANLFAPRTAAGAPATSGDHRLP